MSATETIVMVAAFAALALSVVHGLRLIATAILHRTLRKAVEARPEAAEPMLEKLGAPPPEGAEDERLSVVLIAIGIAMLLASLIIGDLDWMHYGAAGAVFPLIVGTALWLRVSFLRRARRRGAGQ